MLPLHVYEKGVAKPETDTKIEPVWLPAQSTGEIVSRDIDGPVNWEIVTLSKDEIDELIYKHKL